MQKRKGFTLVELVIVIAVIAILAGVLIGTFASVINKANESAKMQEMKAAEHEQKANDILEKLNNAQWFGWEDLETKLGESVQKAVTATLSDKSQTSIIDAKLDATKVAIINAVDETVAKYAQAQGQEQTQLTAEQVKYIVEQAVSKSGGVTEAQVKAIVTSSLQGVSTLNVNQVQRIIDVATAKVTEAGLSSADLASALSNVAKNAKIDDVLTAIENAKKGLSTLTSQEITDIVSRYIKATGESKGDYTWITSAEELNMPATEAALQALSVLSKNGETFKGQIITITQVVGNNATAGNPKSSDDKVIELKDKWIPIQNFEGTLYGDGYEIKNINVEVVYWATNDMGSTGFTYTTGRTSSGWFGERKAFGFIGKLDGTVKDLTLTYATSFEDTKCAYCYFGGVAGVVQGKTTIENVTVQGTITGYHSIGGLVGTVYNYCSADKYDSNNNGGKATNYTGEVDITLKDNSVSVTIDNKTDTSVQAHSSKGALIGEIQKYWIGKVSISGNETPSGRYLFQADKTFDNLTDKFVTTPYNATDIYLSFKTGESEITLGKNLNQVLIY